MKRLGELQVAEGVVEAAADVLPVQVLQTLSAQPIDDFKDGDDLGASALGNTDGIFDMIAVPMADDDKIRLYFHRGCAGGGVGGEERVHDDFITVGFDSVGAVPKPGVGE